MATTANQEAPIRGEEAIIALLAPLTEGHPGAFGLKDDCGVITPPPGADLVVKTDPVAEGVHFLSGDAPADIAWKALAVNVSDLAAKGAAPLCYLMALSFPEAPTGEWMSSFVAGLRAAQAHFGCHLIGGDTDRRPGPVTVSITIIGAVPQGKMVLRTTAQAGDTLFVSGTIGDAALGLALAKEPSLAAAWGLTQAESEYLVGRYRRPEPRLALGPALRRCASAAMDVSDGLVKDLDRLLRASRLAGLLRAADVPLTAAARKIVARAPDPPGGWLARLITAGDDYEVLAAVPAARAAEFRAAAAPSSVAVTEVGRLIPGDGLVVEGADGRRMSLDHTGWAHF